MKEILQKLGLEDFKGFTKIQKIMCIGGNIELLMYTSVMTLISINLTKEGIIDNTLICLSVIIPSLVKFISKDFYDKHKKFIRKKLNIFLLIDFICSCMSSLMIVDDDFMIKKLGYIFIYIIENSLIQTIISYAAIDLQNEIFKTTDEMTEYGKSNQQIRSLSNVIGYTISISVAPILPISITTILLILANSIDSLLTIYILRLLDNNKIKVE